MEFTHTKLKQFLAKLREAEPFCNAPPEDARHVYFKFDDLTLEATNLFKDVEYELKENMLSCTTDKKGIDLQIYYYEHIYNGFDRYYSFCYYWILLNAKRTTYKNKNRETVTLPNFIGTEIPMAEADRLECDLAQLKESIERINKQEVIEKEAKDKLTHRQQILLLNSIGFFELPIFQTLTQKQKGILVSHLLNRTEKDSEDLIRYLKGRNKDKKFEVKTETNVNAIKYLLKKIGQEHLL
jgi:hypothetical protein